MPEAILSDYFYGDEAGQFQHFRIPRQLITNPKFKHLSTDAKLLYGMLHRSQTPFFPFQRSIFPMSRSRENRPKLY